MRVRWPALLLLALLGGCDGSGRFVLALDVPREDQLNPLKDSRLSKFSLRISQGDLITEQEAQRGAALDLLLGSVPVNAPFSLRLAGTSVADEMLGLGFAPEVVVPPDVETQVKVHFRKPVSFVVGEGHLKVLNTLVDTGIELQDMIIEGVSQITATPDGATVLAVNEDQVVPVVTSTLGQLVTNDWRVQLEHPATCIAVSPDGRFAVVCHRSQRAVSLIDLTASPPRARAPLDVQGAPLRVVFDETSQLAHVLVDGVAFGEACSETMSRLVEVDLARHRLGTITPLNKPAVADIILDPRSGSRVIALPCEGQGALGRLRGSTGEIIAVPAPYKIARVDQLVVAIGAGGEQRNRVEVTLVDLTQDFRKPQTLAFDLPPLQVKIPMPITNSGFLLWGAEPRDLEIRDLSVGPDGRRAVALFRARYSCSLGVAANNCEFYTDAEAQGFLVVDLALGTLLFQKYTHLTFSQCLVTCLANFWKIDLCAEEYRRLLREDGRLEPQPFQPATLVTLFGG